MSQCPFYRDGFLTKDGAEVHLIFHLVKELSTSATNTETPGWAFISCIPLLDYVGEPIVIQIQLLVAELPDCIIICSNPKWVRKADDHFADVFHRQMILHQWSSCTDIHPLGRRLSKNNRPDCAIPFVLFGDINRVINTAFAGQSTGLVLRKTLW